MDQASGEINVQRRDLGRWRSWSNRRHPEADGFAEDKE